MVVAGLAGTLAFSWPPSGEETDAPESVPVIPATATTASATTITVTTVAPATGSSPPSTAPLSVLEIVEEGLSAWGRFATSGDLGEMTPWFHADGPQYARFVEEASDLLASPLGPPHYSVILTEEETEGSVVTGRVVFARTGEPSQSFRWRIVVRDRQIWTVAEEP